MKPLATVFGLLAVLSLAASAQAQLRVVSYNTLDKPFDTTDDAELRTIFSAIAATERNGIAKRPDVIALQEQRTTGFVDGQLISTASRMADELNDLFGVTTYDSFLNGSGNDRLAVVFDTAAVSLTATAQVFTTGAPRPTIRARFQPVGYNSPDATLYVYSSHFKAGSSGSDVSTRAAEATSVRANADSLPDDTHAIFAGDFNFGSSFETGYQNFRTAGVAQAQDPIDLSSWPNPSVAEHLTQSTRTSGFSDGGAGGGLDDRFDLQLITNDLLDGEGLTYLGPTSAGLSGLEHSHQAFGNDGVSYNQAINNTFVGRSQSAATINALLNFSDHLPVVADYQLPAVLGVDVEPVPLTVEVGTELSLDVTVTNDAAVLAAVGADELDFSVAVTGDGSGGFSGSVDALSAGFTDEVSFDTLTLGMKTATLTIETTSEGAENAVVEIPIAFEVVASMLDGDVNGDGVVDLLDLDLLGANFGLDPATREQGDLNGDNLVDLLDLDILGANFGATADTAAIPEPATGAVVVLLLGLGFAVGRRSP